MKILTSKNDFKFSFSVKLYLILLHLHQASLEHYLARMWNLCSDTLLQQQGLSHHGLPHGLGRPLPLRRSVDPVSLIFLIKLWTAMREHSKLGCSFQILYAFQPFSLKPFSMSTCRLKPSCCVRLNWGTVKSLRGTSLRGKDERKQTNPGQF